MKHYINHAQTTNSEYHTFILNNNLIKIRLSDHEENISNNDADYFFDLSFIESVENFALQILSEMKPAKIVTIGDFVNDTIKFEGLSSSIKGYYAEFSYPDNKKYPAEKNRNNPNLIKIYFDKDQNREMALVAGRRKSRMTKKEFEHKKCKNKETKLRPIFQKIGPILIFRHLAE